MVQSRSWLAVAVVAVLVVSAACTNTMQGTGPQTQPTLSKATHPVTPSATPSPTLSAAPSTASRGKVLSVAALRAYPGGLVLAAAEVGTSEDRPTRVLVSKNYGATFIDITPAGMNSTDLLRVDDIVARGSARIWVAVWDADSTDETLYRTTDGGTSWQAAPAPEHDAAAGAMDSISFVDARNGWLVQQMPTAPISTLYRTSDAGAHWQPVNRRLPQVAPVVAGTATDLWQAGGFFSDRLTHSTDGGHRWARVALGKQPGRARLFGAPSMFSGQVLEATSSLDRHGEVLEFYGTGDGVNSSRIARLGPLPDEPRLGGGYVRRAQLVFATAQVWWVLAADPRPTVYRTTDAGRHWTGHRLPSTTHVGTKPFLQLASGDGRHAWATIAGRDTAQLLATSDGGRTWSGVDLAKRLTRPTRVEAAQLPRCRSTQLRARVAEFGSEASQPFVTIALRNHSATACALHGYPRLSAVGHRLGGSVKRLRIQIRRGPVYERRDPGHHHVALTPGTTASFSIGTATAYDPPLVTLTRLLVRLPGETASLPVRVQMYATAPRSRPIPVGVTAVRLGIPHSMTSPTNR